MRKDNFLEVLSNILSGTIAIAIIAFGMFLISLMVICVIKITDSRTKYEFYLNGEKGYSYHCESDRKNGARCSIDGNLIQVDQFSEAE